MRWRWLVLFVLFIPRVSAQIPGEITDTVFTHVSHQQYYALFLPSSYSSEKKFPLILFFDPAGRGVVPLQHYRSLAETHQCILVCSYRSRNGAYQPAEEAAYAMLEDISSRYSIDKASVFLAGFSGGARLASFLATQDHAFAGVIACGAFLPDASRSKELKAPYAMVIGDRDMNFLEADRVRELLTKNGTPVLRTFFHGGHDWPPSAAFGDALFWHLLRSGRVSTAEAERQYHHQLSIIRQLIDSSFWKRAADLAEYSHAMFETKIPAAGMDSLLAIARSKKEYARAVKEEEKDRTFEQEWQQKFNDRYRQTLRVAHTDTAFKAGDWKGFESEVRRMRNAKDPGRRLLGARLFDFSWRLFAEQSWMLYGQQEYKTALLHARIWCVVAPDQAEAWLTSARLYAVLQDDKEALSSLREALRSGFRNYAALEQERAFEHLRTTDAYRRLLQEFP